MTIVVPTLNSAATLNATLMSLTAAPGIRVIVADSFSTDDTLAICRRWDVEAISVPAGNMYRAINAGLRMATTEWIAYVNSDDCIFPSSYTKMLEAARRSDAAVVYGSTDYVDAGGRFIFSFRAARGETAARILRAGAMPFCQPAAIFRRSMFEALNGFDEKYRLAGDFDFFCRAALNGFGFQRFSGRPVVAFRVHEGLGATHPEWHRQEKDLIHERLQLKPTAADRVAVLGWSISNTIPYLARILRSRDLFGRFSLQRSSGVPAESDE